MRKLSPMTPHETAATLTTERVGEHVFGFIQGDGSWGHANAGLIADGDELLLVDTFFTLPQTRGLRAAVEEVAPSGRIGTIVNTHLNGDHCWGNQLFPDAEWLTSAANEAGADKELKPSFFQQLREQPPAGEAGKYLLEHFGAFDFTGVEEPRAWTTFTGQASLQVGRIFVELWDMGPAHTDGDVAVHVPEAGVVLCGDLFFHGSHPAVWSGPLTHWATVCDRLLATGAHTFVPGHGPLADRADLTGFRDYLLHVHDHATRAATAGASLLEATRTMPLDAYEEWALPERLMTAVASVYRHLGAPAPHSPFELLAPAAPLAREFAASAAARRRPGDH